MLGPFSAGALDGHSVAIRLTPSGPMPAASAPPAVVATHRPWREEFPMESLRKVRIITKPTRR